MRGFVGVFVVETKFDNARDEALIQCKEKRELDLVYKPVLTWYVDVARSLRDDRLPSFLLNSASGEFQYMLTESSKQKKQIINDWVTEFENMFTLSDSGYKRYFVLVPVESHLITEDEVNK